MAQFAAQVLRRLFIQSLICVWCITWKIFSRSILSSNAGLLRTIGFLRDPAIVWKLCEVLLPARTAKAGNAVHGIHYGCRIAVHAKKASGS